MAEKRIAVVGLGPKGAAIAAKAAALREVGFSTPEIVLFEQNRAGSAWSGQFGYTDGDQELCTSAERDVGFPYDRDLDMAFPNLASTTFAKFSWHAFLVAEGSKSESYGEWVARGRRPPLHRDFADYLSFVASRSGSRIEAATVTHIDYDSGTRQWLLSTNKAHQIQFDGVVITGNGPPYPNLPGSNERVFNGKNFWENLSKIHDLLVMEEPEDRSIVIIGSGGTAAAIALKLIRAGIVEIPIHIIGHEATLYVRVPSYFEDRLFSENDEWKTLAPHTRESFLSRLTKGVVWDAVLQSLNKNRNLTYQSFSARGFRQVPGSSNPAELNVELDYPPVPGIRTAASPSGPVQLMAATVFVDARGFDPWWFVNLFPEGPLKNFFQPDSRRKVQNDVDETLAIVGNLSSGGTFPSGLHVPMMGFQQSPAASNLMALGWMSDRILTRYVSN
jgi:mycobactin lysine-N-oxygenase